MSIQQHYDQTCKRPHVYSHFFKEMDTMGSLDIFEKKRQLVQNTFFP